MDLKQEAMKWAMQMDQIEAHLLHMTFKDDEWPFVYMWLGLQKEAIRLFQVALMEEQTVFQGIYLSLYAAYAAEANKMAEVVMALLILREKT